MEKLLTALTGIYNALVDLIGPLAERINSQDQVIDELESRIETLEESGGSVDPPIDPPVDPPSEPKEILIFHFDGNNNDDDDIAALPIAALYASGAGITDDTYFFYNNSRDEKDVDWQVEAMRESASFAEKLGIRCYDYAKNELQTLQNVVDLLTSGHNITSLEGGPMGTIYRALEQTPEEYHKNITLISHSSWNENRDNSGENKKWNALKSKFPSVTYIDIDDQNPGFFSDDWNWLDAETYPVYVEAREKMLGAKAKKNDASDSGMLFYYLTGKQNATVADAQQWLYLNPPKWAGPFREVEPGLIMGLASSFDIAGTGFELQSDVSGYVGDGYLTYTAPDSFQGLPDTTEIVEEFTPSVSGLYQVQIHNRANDPSDPSQGNDTWITIDAEDFFADHNGEKIYAKENPYGESSVTKANDSAGGFLKFYSNAAGAWTMQTSAVDNNPSPIFAMLEAGQTYILEIAGRSNGHSIDAVFFRHTDLNGDVIDKYLSGSDPVITPPIDPPINPVAPSVEIVSRGPLNPGFSGHFEAIISDVPEQIEKVEFYIDGKIENTEQFHPWESWPTIPENDFEMNVRITVQGGKAYQPAGRSFAPVYTPPAGGGATQRTPINTSAYDTFVAASDGSWFEWDAANDLTPGDVSMNTLESLYNAGDSNTGQPSPLRAYCEDVAEMGGIRALNVIGNENSDGYSQRLSVPKWQEYTRAACVAVELEYFFLPHPNSGNDATDRRGFEPFHWKGCGIQPTGGPPPSGSNPVSQTGKCEFVLMSSYHYGAISGTNKGDQMAAELGQATSFEPSEITGNEVFIQVGLYAHDVTDYVHQSQIFAMKPDGQGMPSTTRLAMKHGRKYNNKFIIEPNEFDQGVDQANGQFIWIMQCDEENGGTPWVAAKLTNRSFTTGAAVEFARGGLGMYINPGDEEPNGSHYGFWVTKHNTFYKS